MPKDPRNQTMLPVHLRTVLVGLCLVAGPIVLAKPQAGPEAEAETSGPSSTTEVPVWGPGLESTWWDQMVATIVLSNDEYTSYCAFCRTDVENPCTLPEGSMTFAQGPSTVIYATPIPQSIDVRCQLEGTSKATCTATTEGEDPKTSTLTGTQIEWGTLTLGQKPASVPTLVITTDPITDDTGRTIDLTDTRVTSTPTATRMPSEASNPRLGGITSTSSAITFALALMFLVF